MPPWGTAQPPRPHRSSGPRRPYLPRCGSASTARRRCPGRGSARRRRAADRSPPAAASRITARPALPARLPPSFRLPSAPARVRHRRHCGPTEAELQDVLPGTARHGGTGRCGAQNGGRVEAELRADANIFPARSNFGPPSSFHGRNVISRISIPGPAGRPRPGSSSCERGAGGAGLCGAARAGRGAERQLGAPGRRKSPSVGGQRAEQG